MIYYHLDDVLIRRLMSYHSNEHYIDVLHYHIISITFCYTCYTLLY